MSGRAGSQRVRGSSPLSSTNLTWAKAMMLCVARCLWCECALIFRTTADPPVSLMGAVEDLQDDAALGGNNGLRRVCRGRPGRGLVAARDRAADTSPPAAGSRSRTHRYLIAVFPANVYVAVAEVPIEDLDGGNPWLRAAVPSRLHRVGPLGSAGCPGIVACPAPAPTRSCPDRARNGRPLTAPTRLSPTSGWVSARVVRVPPCSEPTAVGYAPHPGAGSAGFVHDAGPGTRTSIGLTRMNSRASAARYPAGRNVVPSSRCCWWVCHIGTSVWLAARLPFRGCVGPRCCA